MFKVGYRVRITENYIPAEGDPDGSYIAEVGRTGTVTSVNFSRAFPINVVMDSANEDVWPLSYLFTPDEIEVI